MTPKETLNTKESHAMRAREKHDLSEMRKREKKVNDGVDMAPLVQRVNFLKKVVFPDKSVISQRNIETWAKNYSLWRLKKATSRIKRMLENGEELTNPEGLYFSLLRNPDMESTEVVELARDAAEMWMDLNDRYFRIHDDYIISGKPGEDVSLALGQRIVIETMQRWDNAG